MQSMQRQFGKLWSKGPGDNAKFSVLLNDYEDADKVLAKIIDNAKLWRDSWGSLLSSQLQLVTEYEGLYDPIVGASDGHGRQAAPTPHLQLERTFKLKTAYSELRTELVEEITTIEQSILRPATDARDCIAPIRKTIKKRENKRLDYEKLQDKTVKLQRKPGRTPKEDAALAKAEAEMSRAADEFGCADEHLRQTLPPIITASFNLVGPLLSNLVLIQNRLLGLYYTTLHNYCEEFGFPSPPPPMEDVIATWNAAVGPVRSEIESIGFVARGKGIHHPPMSSTTDAQSRNPPRPPQAPPSEFHRTPSGLISTPRPRTLRVPSATSLRAPSPASSPDRSRPNSGYNNNRPDYAHATDFTTATMLGGSAVSRSAGEGHSGQRDHYSSSPQAVSPSASLSAPRSQAVANSNNNSSGSSSGALAKKKKPPPPPPKRVPSVKPDEWVVAQYAFAGQGQGDLAFREGDRIKVVTKTDSVQDWWVGELDGTKGNFPANYCKPL